jgi:hypothetical protein
MEEIESESFRINILLILKNFVLVSLFLMAFPLFSKKHSFGTAFILILILGGLYFLYNIISEKLISINVYTKDHKVNFQFSRFIFMKSEFTLGTNEFFYSFKEEVGGRGTMIDTFTVYSLNKEKIIKITPYSSGWREEQIMTIIYLWKDLGVEEYKS